MVMLTMLWAVLKSPHLSLLQPVRTNFTFLAPCVNPCYGVAFRAPATKDIGEIDFRNPQRHIYSRYTQQVSSRVEHVLSRINVNR
jgi:hypothetical protein